MAFQFVSVQQVSSAKLCFAAAVGPISVRLKSVSCYLPSWLVFLGFIQSQIIGL
jgi:hypothetical protein